MGATSNQATSTDKARISDAVAVGTASVIIAAANPARVEIHIQNDHATQILYLGFGTAAVANKGFRVLPVGANTFQSSAFRGEIYGIASGATTPALVTEFG